MVKTDTLGGPGAKKRIDPHKWEKRVANLVLGDDFIVRRGIQVNVCAVCGFWCEERPEHLHDLPPCSGQTGLTT